MRIALLMLPASLLGCMGMYGEGSRVENKPDASQPLKEIKLRVGIFASQTVREYHYNFSNIRVDLGSMLMSDVEGQFRRVFDQVTSVYKFPPSATEAEHIDVVIVIENPEFVWADKGGGEYEASFKVSFCVCTVSGARVDPDTEQSACKVIMRSMSPTANETSAREGTTAVIKATVHQFLLKAPGIMNKRYDK